MRRLRLGWVGLLVAAVIATASVGGVLAQGGEDGDYTWAGDVNAPDFPADAEWINASAPISLADLRGKIVLLDFWTYGCINCMHVIPDLKRLEAEYPDALVVIGIHSAKFENEGDTENIRRIVQRYEIKHPVLNDRDFVVWQSYTVNAWPTFMLLDPFGKIVGQLSGEPLYERIQPIIEVMAQEYGAAGVLNTAPLAQWSPEAAADNLDTPLRFPGKVLVDEAGGRLFISDSNHNRIVVVALDGYEILDVIGDGAEGWRDGDYATAQFFRPQGLALVGSTLYVADTENHAVRAIDLEAGTVTTAAGNGQIGWDRAASGPGPEISLNSPWDVVAFDTTLYIAMAGTHQLWTYDLTSGIVGAFAGTGQEALLDGALASAGLNQPSGIDTDGTLLYFADAEASAIRTADLTSDGELKTIVGTGLFDFGDQDGTGDDVLLQHPLGVTVADDGYLYVADTYNNKIKRIDPAKRTSETFAGTGDAGLVDGAAAEAAFYEPGGLDYAGGKLYVADTNNHAVRVIDVATGEVSTVEFPNVERLASSASAAESQAAQPTATPDASAGLFGATQITLPPQVVAPGEGTLNVMVTMPEGYKLNAQAPFTAVWPDDPVAQVPADQREFRVALPELPIEFPVTFVEGQTELALSLTVYWCEGVNETLCFVDRSELVLPLTVTATGGTHSVTFQRDLVPPLANNSF